MNPRWFLALSERDEIEFVRYMVAMHHTLPWTPITDYPTKSGWDYALEA